MSRATKNRKVDRRTVYDWVQQVLSDDGLDQSSGLTGRICDALGIEQRYPSPTFTAEELKVNEWDFSPLVRAEQEIKTANDNLRESTKAPAARLTELESECIKIRKSLSEQRQKVSEGCSALRQSALNAITTAIQGMHQETFVKQRQEKRKAERVFEIDAKRKKLNEELAKLNEEYAEIRSN